MKTGARAAAHPRAEAGQRHARQTGTRLTIVARQHARAGGLLTNAASRAGALRSCPLRPPQDPAVRMRCARRLTSFARARRCRHDLHHASALSRRQMRMFAPDGRCINIKAGDGGQAMAGLLCGCLLALNGQTLSGFFVFGWQEPCPGGLYEAKARLDQAEPAQLRPGKVASRWSRPPAVRREDLPGRLAALPGWRNGLLGYSACGAAGCGAYPWSGGTSAVVPVAIAIRRSR